MVVTESWLRRLISSKLCNVLEAAQQGPEAYVGPYVVPGTPDTSDREASDEEMCDQLGSQLASLGKQRNAPGADIQSIQKQIELVTNGQAKACG